jgi:molecular chaperone DnaJ
MHYNKDINYYNILQVNFDFDKKTIKTNYRNLSKKYHPDVNDNDDTNFKLVAEAYKVLTNEDVRKEYDKYSKFGQNYDSKLELLDFEFSNQNVTDINVYNKKDEYKKKEMLHIVVNLDEFKPLISYTRNIICSNCEGTGNVSASSLNLRAKYKGEDLGSLFDDEMECDICNGTGRYGNVDCPGCKGTGEIKLGLSQCDKCKGNGLIEKKRQIKLKESDFKDGKLMLEYYGNYSKYDGRVGNLYITIK